MKKIQSEHIKITKDEFIGVRVPTEMFEYLKKNRVAYADIVRGVLEFHMQYPKIDIVQFLRRNKEKL